RFDNVAYSISASEEETLGPREAPNAVPWTQGLPAEGADDLIILPWNDLELLEQTLRNRAGEISAVMTSPAMCNAGCIAPRAGFLQGMRELCDELGILLIFDEVITGFRLGMAGGQGYFGVTPDVAVFGKAMASGFPISVLTGKREYMEWIADGRVIHAGTMNSGNPSIAAAAATIDVLER